MWCGESRVLEPGRCGQTGSRRGPLGTGPWDPAVCSSSPGLGLTHSPVSSWVLGGQNCASLREVWTCQRCMWVRLKQSVSVCFRLGASAVGKESVDSFGLSVPTPAAYLPIRPAQPARSPVTARPVAPFCNAQRRGAGRAKDLSAQKLLGSSDSPLARTRVVFDIQGFSFSVCCFAFSCGHDGAFSR